jgi:anti-anti-sigma factor
MVPEWGCAPFVSRDGDRTVVWLGGECDIATAGLVTDTLTEAISLGDGDLIVDMSAVTFIGTVTIVALTQTRDALRRQSRSLTVRSPSKCVRRLLTVCGQADLIEPE